MNNAAQGGSGARSFHWPVEALREAGEPALPGFKVEVLRQVESTNTELMRRARDGVLGPVLLIAEHQTAGRGRLGRQWFSDAWPDVGAAPACLTFSLGLPLMPVSWSGLSLAVGLSVAQSLHPDLKLKWPNDVWWRERKLGGILIETANSPQAQAQRYAVVGIGINIGPPQASSLATPPAWLGELLPDVDAAQALERILAPLIGVIKAFEQHGFAPLQRSFNARDALAGRAVILSDGTSGQAQGVDGTGALRVYSALGLQSVTSAEVSVRPVPAPLNEKC